ncbi:androgen-binding protein-like, partial [Sigmodon hispidus]
MKGTLLLLALLVTGELGFQTTEACVPYFEAYTVVVAGDKKIMNDLISKFDPTAGEREALEKVQECFNEQMIWIISMKSPNHNSPLMRLISGSIFG